MKACRFLEPVLHGVGHAAAFGAAGVDCPAAGAIELAQGGKQALAERRRVGLLAIGDGLEPGVERRFLGKAEDGVARGEVGVDIIRRRLAGAGDDDDLGLGGVVAVFHSRGLGADVGAALPGDGRVDLQLAQGLAQLLRRDAAGAEQAGNRAGQVDDRRFQADLAGAAIDNGGQGTVCPVIVEDVLGRRR